MLVDLKALEPLSRPTSRSVIQRVAFSMIPVVALALTLRYAHHTYEQAYYYMPMVIETVSVMLIIEALVPGIGVLQPVLESPWMASIARISYGLYLWHYLVFSALRKRMHLHWTLGFLVGCAITFTLSILSYRIVEQRALRLKHRFERV
jgi:peptidoglycan/LPS O-acetylase OafA/YrhL